MKMHDINREQAAVILLLHPMLATAELMETLLAAPMGKTYRYLIPDLSGHGTASADPYESAAAEAAQIRNYLQEQKIERITLAFGASLGGAVLMELLQSPGIAVDHLFFEGASMNRHAFLLEAVSKLVLTRKLRKASQNPELAVSKMGRLFGEKAKHIMARQLAGMSEENLGRMLRDCTHVHLPNLTPEQQKACIFAYGEKDYELKRARQVCPKKYPSANLTIWPGRGHCTYLAENPTAYAIIVKTCIMQHIAR